MAAEAEEAEKKPGKKGEEAEKTEETPNNSHSAKTKTHGHRSTAAHATRMQACPSIRKLHRLELERALAVEMLEQVAFVGLVPA